MLKALLNYVGRHKDMLLYLIFGVFTTAVNICAYWILAHPIKTSVMAATVSAWIIAVLFAYLTNRKWVFNSQASGAKRILGEVMMFFACRLATGVVDWLMMYVFVERMSFNDVMIKCIANIVVIILNYVASKFIIFKK